MHFAWYNLVRFGLVLLRFIIWMGKKTTKKTHDDILSCFATKNKIKKKHMDRSIELLRN